MFRFLLYKYNIKIRVILVVFRLILKLILCSC